MVQNDDTRERITKALNKVGCFGPNLIRECVDAVMTALVSGGSEWTALREAVEAVAKDAVQIAIMRSDLTWDADTEQTEESIAEDAAQALFGEGTCSDEPTANVKKLLALAAAAPAPHHRWPTTRNKAETGAPPPQDGQGAELLGPPRGGSSSDLADSSNLSVGDEVTLKGKISCVNESPLWYGVQFKPANARFPYNLMCYPNDIETSPSKAEREVATATNGLRLRCMARHPEGGQCELGEGHARKHLAGMLMWEDAIEDATNPVAGPEYVRTMEAPSLPEAVAGNASAPVGEKRPSGVGEPREKPTNLQAEPPYPNHETVVMAMRAPNWTIHVLTDRCRKDWPHEMKDCAEWAIRPEVGEPRTALQSILDHLVMIEENWNPEDSELRGRVKNMIAEADAALAAPAPKPVPPAEHHEIINKLCEAISRLHWAIAGTVNVQRAQLKEAIKFADLARIEAEQLAVRRAAERKPPR